MWSFVSVKLNFVLYIQQMNRSACFDRRTVCNPRYMVRKCLIKFGSSWVNVYYTFLTFRGLKAGPSAIFFCSSSSSTICCRVFSGGHFLSPRIIFNICKWATLSSQIIFHSYSNETVPGFNKLWEQIFRHFLIKIPFDLIWVGRRRWLR